MRSSDPVVRGYSPGMAVERLESLLRDAFPDAPELRVEDRTGGGDHFQVTVESPRFDGLPLLERVFGNPDSVHEDVAAAMQPPLAAVEASATLDEVFATLTGGGSAVVVARDGKPVGVLTRSDLLEFLAHRS